MSTYIAQAVLHDSKGRVWIGTDGGGLNLFQEGLNVFTHYHSLQSDPTLLSSDKIIYLADSYDGRLWVCTWDEGFHAFTFFTIAMVLQLLFVIKLMPDTKGK